VIETLEKDGHMVLWAHDGISATEQARSLKMCDLVISNSRVAGQAGVDLIIDLRKELPWVSILYLANPGRSTPEQEEQLPSDVPILREPFSAEELRAAVSPLLQRG
jgi:DNA-binding response OmpR family regulator